MSKMKNLVGIRFGRLTVVERTADRVYSNGVKAVTWLCRCDCGKMVTATRAALSTGDAQSCGCMRRDTIRRMYKRINEYSFYEQYVVGYTQKNEPFYVDKDDYDKIKDYCWRKTVDGYIVTTIDRKSLYLHRMLMDAEDGLVVDHINHDTTDNRRSNLRVVTQSQNMQNAVLCKRNSSTEKGVNWDEKMKKWHARIVVNHRTIDLGYYEDFNKAVNKRKAAEEKYFGEYSYDNSMAASPVIDVA